MRTLAIETASEACSVALFEAGGLIAHRHEVLGRGHAERLVPMIAELPDRGKAEAIRVSLGPGSFTGVRIGLAVARALGIAWHAQVRGYPTFALLAAMARQRCAAPLTVCVNGGHGQWFVQDFGDDGRAQEEIASLSPEQAQARPFHRLAVGNRARELVSGSALSHEAMVVLPDARAWLLLEEGAHRDSLTPLYGRPPDARLPAA